MNYNTQRKKLVMPEYGRYIQQMVDYAIMLSDREERQRCACTIVSLMANIHEQHGDPEDIKRKLWNHLAAMADYKLDIDYPVEIEHRDEAENKREFLQYPQKKIQRRHYGAILETLAHKLPEIEDEEKRDALAKLVANQMKRSLAMWNRDVMCDDKVIDDLTRYTEGKIQLDPYNSGIVSDEEILNGIQPSNSNKKKKRK